MPTPTPEDELKWAEDDLKEADGAYKSAQARLDEASDDWQWCYDEVQRLKRAVKDERRAG